MPALLPEKPLKHAFIYTLSPSESAIDTQLYRIFSLTSCRTCKDLSHVLGISLSAVHNGIKKMRSGGNVPDAWLVHLSRQYGLVPEWIVTGKGPSLINETTCDGTICDDAACDGATCDGAKRDDARHEELALEAALRSYTSEHLLQELLRRTKRFCTPSGV